MSKAQKIIKELKSLADPAQARVLASFFKTGVGEYGAGDIFWGIKVPQSRSVAQRYADAPLAVVQDLLASPVHEQRLTALLIIVGQFRQADRPGQARLFDFYLNNLEHVNNWDLVDLSCPPVVGAFLRDRPRGVLYELAQSANLWARRVSIVSTHSFIREGDYADTLAISRQLLTDQHDLIHKAVGWMLREVGKREQTVLEAFLDQHWHQMSRTTLRYAIERLPESLRKSYLTRKVVN